MTIETVKVPAIDGADSVDVIEICISVGDKVELDQSLIVLESDKASMEVPSPVAGKVTMLHLKEGATVTMGDAIVDIEVEAEVEAKVDVETEFDADADADAEDETGNETTEESAADKKDSEPIAHTATQSEPEAKTPAASVSAADLSNHADAALVERQAGGDVYAGPAVRKLAREMGVELMWVKGSGAHGRILVDDVRAFVKTALKPARATGTDALPSVPAVDFTQFGAVDQQPLSKLHKLTAQNMQRSWLNVPHVTHFDDADITDLEDYRASLKPIMEKRGVKLSPLPFLVKACALTLRNNREFNASLLPDGEHIAYKQFYHIGLAVDTAAGLMVPVLHDVDRKSIWEIAEEMAELSTKAKDRKLTAAEMQGACFTVSSLGNIGGTGFTPIVNTPEIGILGVARTAIKPVYIDAAFVPRKLLPLSLSYDHRAVNGAHAGKFMTDLCNLMADIRRQIL